VRRDPRDVISRAISFGSVRIPPEGSAELRFDGDPSFGEIRFHNLMFASRGVDVLEVERVRIGDGTYLEGPVPARVFVGETMAERYARHDALAGQIRELPGGFRCELCLRESCDRDAIEHDDVCPFVGPEPMTLGATIRAGESVAVALRNVGPTEVRAEVVAICYSIPPPSGPRRG